ncbi:MAG: 2-dehydropantoate 2-reductase [Gammaproteobacteria bacterium]|nr:MAG: 2-dehydropantoate 2-reductase [Gammaproteobacteria bacterium]RLA24516.1 MAG: 2-dehydropantoate 2-reductase [Gammaproteobacteria bacterium]
MHFAIIGAGGIGCYYGVRLLEAGHSVDFVARDSHLQVLQEKGLTLKHDNGNYQEKVSALSLETLLSRCKISDYDGLIVTLKATQTTAVAQQLKGWCSSSGQNGLPWVLSLQNGVENESILKSLSGLPVLGGIARRIGAHIIEPGVVEAVGPAEVILGGWPNHNESKLPKAISDELATVFNEAQIPTEVTDDIRLELWRKLVINNGVNALSALVKEKTGVITAHPQLAKVIRGLMDEAARAAKSESIFLSEKDVDKMFELILTFDSIKPSMFIDREKGRPLELDEICGVVMRGCEKQGVDAPYTRTVSSLLGFSLEQDGKWKNGLT